MSPSRPPFTDAIPETLASLETVAAAILSTDGRVREANPGFHRLLDGSEHADADDVRQLFLQPRFAELADATEADRWDAIREGLINLGDPEAEEATSLTGTVHGRGDRLVLLAERDLAGERKLRDRVLQLNDELNEAQREMKRELEARKRAERRLEAKTEALERSNERLEEFAYVISHDLQEPLRLVTSYLQLLDREEADDLDADARSYLEHAVDGAKRMREMIEALLDYARVGSAAAEPEPVDLGTVVDEVLDGLRLRVEETEAEIRVGELPTVRADQGQMGHLFQNLVANALDHASPAPTIEIGTERVEDGTARCYVADDGPGIPSEDKAELFDLFQRGEQAAGEGTGIGLAVCQRIVERHGGAIGVTSEPGEGARFWLELPLPDEASP